MSDEEREALLTVYEHLALAASALRRVLSPVTEADRRWAENSARAMFGADGKQNPDDLAAVALRAMEMLDKHLG